MKEIVWNSLVESLRAEKCVLVLGSDVPATLNPENGATTPASQSMRDQLSSYLSKQLEEENQKVVEPVLFAVAQQYDDTPAVATVNLKNIAAGFLRNSRCAPGPLHVELARCPFGLVLTPCHDNLLERALSEQGKSPTSYFYHYRGEQRDNRELDATPDATAPAVYHLFGTFEEPNSLVLTENDLLDFAIRLISKRPKLPDSLSLALRDKTFLFVGFGIRHWYIRVLLKLLMRTLELSGGSVAIESLGELDAREREQTVLFYRRGTRVEVVDMDASGFVRELRERFEQAGGITEAPRRRGRRLQVFISYERSDDDIARKLHEALPREQFDAWLDTQLLEGGDDWNQQIEDKIKSSDYFLVLNSPYLAHKDIGYVNKELALAFDQQKYRKPGAKFIIPLGVAGLAAEEGRSDLRSFQQLPLRANLLQDDVAVIAKTMARDSQLRNR